jgi:small subunit ribosomal protein S7
MSRRFSAPKRYIIPDAKYGDQLVAKFVNSLMLAGERYKDEPLDVFKKALDAVKPRVEVKSRRVGGATYQVPVEVRSDRRNALAMRWLVQYSRARGEKSMEERLAAELMEASQGRGNAVKKREDTHKMADANKAFAHYRW